MLRCSQLLLVLCLGLLSSTHAAETIAETNQAGLAAYRAGDLSSARVLWEDELGQGAALHGANERARLCYNLGTLAARENRQLDAVAWYSAALRLRPRDKDTWANLELARLSTGLEAADRGDLKATVQRLLASLTLGESSLLALLGWLPLTLVLAYEALRGGRRTRALAGLSLLLGLLCASPWVRHEWQRGEQSVMIVAEESAGARSEPRADAPQVADLEAGEILQQVDHSPGWVEVQYESRRRGWVRSQDVFELNR